MFIVKLPVPIVVKLPPIVNTASNWPIKNEAPVFTVNDPFIALAVPASEFSKLNVPLLIVTLFGYPGVTPMVAMPTALHSIPRV